MLFGKTASSLGASLLTEMLKKIHVDSGDTHL